MTAGQSIPANFAWTLAGYAVYAACQWGMLVALAKLGNPNMVGQFALALAITAPLTMLTNLQLRAVLATDTCGEYAFADYLGLRIASAALALLVLPALAGFSRAGRITFLVILLAGLAKAVESISDIYFGLRQRHEQMQPIARSLIAKGLLSLFAFSLALRLTHSLLWAMLGMFFAWSAVLFLYDVRATHLIQARVVPRFSPVLLRRLAWRSLPLGVMSMLVSINANMPRYFIEAHLGAAALGIFAALLYPMTTGTFVVTALAQAALPVLARHFLLRGIGPEFLRLLAVITSGGLLLGGAGIVLCIFAGRRLLIIFYRPEYAAHTSVLVWLAAAAALNYAATFLNAGVTATRAFSALTVPYAVQAAFAAGLSAALVAHAGLIGAAWASCAISAAGCAIPLMILFRVHARRAQAGVPRRESPRYQISNPAESGIAIP